jgi:2-amino-4-hydroxy-6-hydroxymethyldihydropteridine diphosphokinase
VSERSDCLLIALGANLPQDGTPPIGTLTHAIAALQQAGLTDLSVSRFFATPCFPAGAGPDYVNAALSAHCPAAWDAARVLALLHDIEHRHGRKRETRWGMRTLDLDLIAMGNAVLPDEAGFLAWHDLDPDLQGKAAPDRLILPHPRLQDRAFVLVPLADVAADWVHPVLGKSVARMLADLPAAARAEVHPILS